MRKVTRSIPVAVLALCLAAAQLPAQQPGSGNFQWYIGGQGGILNFETIEGRHTIPLAGGHLLVTARRTGLLLSVDEGLGSSEVGVYTLQTVDASGAVVQQQSVAAGYKDLRKYSATLLAFPIKGPATPYFGIGVGILHTSGNTPDDDFTKSIGSTGFGTVIGGLNFRVSRFSAFGQYQLTTAPSEQIITQRFADGSKMIAFGNLFTGPTHTFTAGLRFGLGNARERASGGGY
ncbi:MAG: hypothetical protein ACJ8BF_14160 [Gemmatimonadales bacterium]